MCGLKREEVLIQKHLWLLREIGHLKEEYEEKINLLEDHLKMANDSLSVYEELLTEGLLHIASIKDETPIYYICSDSLVIKSQVFETEYVYGYTEKIFE